jgi:hypothetical protein
MNRYLPSNIPHIVDLQTATAQTVETRIDEAIQRMRIAVSDSYDNFSVFSIYWKSDDTGGAEERKTAPFSSGLFRSSRMYKHASEACPMTLVFLD